MARVLEELGVVPDELTESSGLAVSRTQPGVLWSHNDSGDGPNLYAIDPSGRLLAVFPVANAAAVDWEDMSSGPCPASLLARAPLEGAACLYLADSGDNDRPAERTYGLRGRRAAARGHRREASRDRGTVVPLPIS